MKGFIEITYNKANGGHKVLININQIERVEPYTEEQKGKGFEDTNSGIITKDLLNVQETYEEIKQKIKEATEPRLMIDEKGNFKEVK